MDCKDCCIEIIKRMKIEDGDIIIFKLHDDCVPGYFDEIHRYVKEAVRSVTNDLGINATAIVSRGIDCQVIGKDDMAIR